MVIYQLLVLNATRTVWLDIFVRKIIPNYLIILSTTVLFHECYNTNFYGSCCGPIILFDRFNFI